MTDSSTTVNLDDFKRAKAKQRLRDAIPCGDALKPTQEAVQVATEHVGWARRGARE